MKQPFSIKPIVLSVVFGILLMWLDYSDKSPILDYMGNLDHVFGAQMWYPTEVFLPFASIAVFILFGKVCLDLGKSGRVDGINAKMILIVKKIKPTALLFFYLILLVLIDIDDILAVLRIQSNLRVSDNSPGYWLAMEAIYPVLSLVTFALFGKICFEIGGKEGSNLNN